MFGFCKKKSEGFKALPAVRDCWKAMVGETINVYVGTTVGFLTGHDKTKKVNRPFW